MSVREETQGGDGSLKPEGGIIHSSVFMLMENDKQQ